MAVYKINDIIACEFLKIPKAMFANETYRRLSSDAKLAYALLYDRLSLSKLNGWINERDEVYLIYTREEIAEDLGITYKKAIAAFRELTEVNLIAEQRCGRGMPNRIYIVKPELDAAEAKKYVKRENLRTADSAHQANAEKTEELPESPPKNCENGTSRTAESEAQDVPKSHTNKTDNIKTDFIHTDYSQSVPFPRYLPDEVDRQMDEIYSLDDILKSCQLDTFEDEERRILYDALERLFYSDSLKIGNAVLPREKVRSRMYEIDVNTLRAAIDKLHRNTAQIRNVTAYVMSTIFNCITEEYSAVHVDPFLNEMRPEGVITMFMNAFQQYIAELLDEYGGLLSRQLLAAVNHKFAAELPNIDGYAAQMCRYGDYEKIAYGGDFILCRKSCEPNYDIICAFDVMLSFQPQVIWHRRSREPVAMRFFVSTIKHDKEMLVIPVKQGDEREISAYAADKFDNNPCVVVIFLLESKEQMKRIHADCNCRYALITSNGVAFFKK